jgi:two-component system NtrC family sensor kinase
MAILALAVGSWLFVAIILSNRLVDAVGYLDATAKRIALGDFGPIKPKKMFSMEFADLQAAFESMLQRFNATREQLDSQMSEERRMREALESLQGQVIRQERLAAVGQLVSGVAHEINNPLQSISGFAELMRLQRNLPESAHNDLNIILRESARANAIIRNLALFARHQPGPAARVHLGEVIAAVAELRQRRLESEQIELRIEDSATRPVLAVLTELQQVVLNFVINAEQAILQSGRVPARVTIRTFDRQAHVALEVEDTGPGVNPEDEPHLFEPFFTTKPVGQGTGLGLSISYGIIESMGGKIAYRPAPARGSIFYFELPAATG